MRNKYSFSWIIVLRVRDGKGPYSEYGSVEVAIPSFYHLGRCVVDYDYYENLFMVLLLWKVPDDFAALDVTALVITDVNCFSGTGLRASYAG